MFYLYMVFTADNNNSPVSLYGAKSPCPTVSPSIR